MDACCAPSAPPESAAFAAEAERCAAAACDPTLEACCQRDLEEAAAVARLKAQLSLHDRSKERERLAAAVLGVPPPAAPQQQRADSEEEEEDDDDEFVGRLRAQRLAELQRAAEAKARAQAAGHGALVDVPEVRLLPAAADAGPAPLVAHVAWEGSPLGDELDEHLAGLAHRYLGTRFARVRAGPASTLHLRLRTPPGPGLLCFREGALVGAASLDHFGAPECLLEERVDAWLRQRRCLVAAPGGEAAAPARGTVGGGGDSRDSSSGEEDEGGGGDEWQQPCEVCGRRYPHQHIRSVYARRGDSRSDSEGEG